MPPLETNPPKPLDQSYAAFKVQEEMTLSAIDDLEKKGFEVGPVLLGPDTVRISLSTFLELAEAATR